MALLTVNPASALLSLAPGPPQIIQSSESLPWQGFLLEKHLSSPGERAAGLNSRHVISLLCCQSSRFESRTSSGNFVPYLKTAGAITIMPVGPIPEVKLLTPSELIHCALEGSFVQDVIEEMDHSITIEPEFHSGIRDTSIQRILTLLLEELEAGAPSGILYADSLAHALTVRYLKIEHTTKMSSVSRASALPAHVLNRVREWIEANLHADLGLITLAKESGYSRAHFLRMFRVATGMTPHQYLLELRISRAQEFLRKNNSSLIDIAAACGFSSQSHMTSIFRKRLGITPAGYRRSLQ